VSKPQPRDQRSCAHADGPHDQQPGCDEPRHGFLLQVDEDRGAELEANKDWRPDLKGFAEQWAKESTAMLERSFGMGSHLGSLSGTLSKDLPEAMGPWLSFLMQAASSGHVGEAMLGGTAGLNRLLSMEGDASSGRRRRNSSLRRFA
jgi:hypothetical protein